MAVNKRLLQGAAAAGGLVPSEHFGVALYEGDGSSSHSINGGKFGAGAYFNGSSSVITLPSALSDGATMDASCISFWFNVGAEITSATSNKEFMSFAYSGGSTGKITAGATTGNFTGETFSVSSDIISQYTYSKTNIPAGWNHAVVQWNSGNTKWDIYINGVAHTTYTYGTNEQGKFALKFGNRNQFYYEGKLDQVRIFQKALTSSQVSTLYAETAATVESLDPLSEDTTDTLQVLGDSSCLATYRFENDEDDLSGNYDGTGTEIQYAAGRYGQAASFNGSSSNVDIGSFGSTFQQNFTVSLWFNLNSLSALNNLFSAQDDYYAYMMARNDINKVRAQIEVSPSTAYNIDSGTISTNTWYHAVITVSSTDGFKFYMNNELQGTQAAATGNLRTMSGKSFIGGYQSADPGTFQYPLDGKIDQVRIFNKALSASEVTTLYNENSLVASYRFEGNANDDTRNYDGTATNVTYEYGLGFTPDFVWIKDRGNAEQHILNDSTRGATKDLSTNTSAAEATRTTGFLSFDDGGFTLGSDGGGVVNDPTRGPYVAWAWKANGGTTSSNTDGSITSTVQVNEDAGFSIVTYTGAGGVDTVGHGLSAQPELMFIKNRGRAVTGAAYATGINQTGYLFATVGGSDGFITARNDWMNNDTPPTSSLFTVRSYDGAGNDTQDYVGNYTGDTYVAYLFHSVEGFSKIGSYTGNGTTNGPIVETGFEPAFVMIKRTDSTGVWVMLDNKRNLTNPRNSSLYANTSAQEDTGSTSGFYPMNFYSNGFQPIQNTGDYNANGGTYLYLAFAADPDTEAPTVAKSFSTVTYTGDGTYPRAADGSDDVTLDFGFPPGLVWGKSRDDGTLLHVWVDKLRGNDKQISSNLTDAEATKTSPAYTFDGDTLVVTSNGNLNNNDPYVAWAWKADDNEPTIFGGPAKAVYKFEDNANDVTGNNNASSTSNVTYTSNGKFNKAAVFNGSTSKVNLPNGSFQYNELTISVWVKPAGSGNRTILDTYGAESGSSRGYILRIDNSTNKASFVIYNGDCNNAYPDDPSCSNVTRVISSNAISTSEYTHIVVTMKIGELKMYINGVLDDSTITQSIGYKSSAITRIGFFEYALGAEAFYNGEIDQLRIYNGVVSDVGVAALYAETTSENDDLELGAPPKSIVSANANAGFSIVKYEGTGSNTKVPHGLSAAPEMVITKRTDTVANWTVGQFAALGTDGYLKLNTTDIKITATNVWNDTAPTSTVVNIGTSSATNTSGGEYISYCFHSVSSYSKIGSYSGTGSAGNAQNVGFTPDWLMVKRYVGSASQWVIIDSVRGTKALYADLSNAESSESRIFLNSTGFEFTGSAFNESSTEWIYMAFKIN